MANAASGAGYAGCAAVFWLEQLSRGAGQLSQLLMQHRSTMMTPAASAPPRCSVVWFKLRRFVRMDRSDRQCSLLWR